jgi:type II secretory pathway component HofQ
MKVPLGLLYLLPALALGACASSQESRDEIPKLHREASPDSAGVTGKKEFKDIVVRPSKPEDRLVGKWPRDVARMSVDAYKTSVRSVLEEMRKLSRLNFVVADSVSGEVSATLKDVPWVEVLLHVLEDKDLVAVREGNVVRILPKTEWIQENQ